MDILEAIGGRCSIRGFCPDPIPKETLKEILEIATHAPSALNIQPWEFAVLTGDVLKNVQEGNMEMLNAGTSPNQDQSGSEWPHDSVYRHRQVELGKNIFKLMGIQREDKEKRTQWAGRGFRYFDAPAAIIILADRSITENGFLLDIGAVMQTICLAAINYGLGTCIENQGVMYPQALRKHAHIPDNKRIIVSIAIGYPDWDFPANKLETTREDVDNITSWYGFT